MLTPNLLLFLIVALLGLGIGSFINMLVYRVHNGIAIGFSRSRCDHCGHKLGVLDLIPIFSRLFLKGECRYCGKQISKEDSYIEAVTALVFVVTLAKFIGEIDTTSYTSVLFGLSTSMIISLVLSVFIFFALYDIKFMEVPDKVSIPALIMLLIVNAVLFGYELLYSSFEIFGLSVNPGANVLASIVSAGFIALIVLVTKGKGMGGGDIRIAAMIGLISGWVGILVGLYTAFLSGSLFGIALAVSKGKFKGLKMPFVPFLSFGAITAFLYGDSILKFLFPFF